MEVSYDTVKTAIDERCMRMQTQCIDLLQVRGRPRAPVSGRICSSRRASSSSGRTTRTGATSTPCSSFSNSARRARFDTSGCATSTPDGQTKSAPSSAQTASCPTKYRSAHLAGVVRPRLSAHHSPACIAVLYHRRSPSPRHARHLREARH